MDLRNKIIQCHQQIPMIQNLDEIEIFTQRVLKLQPQSCLEIGLEKGGTFNLWNQLINKGVLIGVDITDTVQWDKLKINQNLVYFIEGDSTNPETIKEVHLRVFHLTKTLCHETGVDFLFIDGCHKYDMVKQDFINYKRFVKKGGIVALHDIFDGAGVMKCWQEIRSGYRHEEIHSQNHGIGIGILYT